MLKATDISKNYGQKTVLSNISIELNDAEIIGLLGINGAGKSTLMKILVGILEPDTGSVELNGYSITSLEARRLIGYLSEDNPLYDDMYVKEYLLYIAGLYHLPRKTVDAVIEQTGLESEYKKKIKALSKGNRQRVGLAQAIIHDPYLLVLDEPTVGLDPVQRRNINNLLITLSSSKIIVLSTHLLEDVKDTCSGIILLNSGEMESISEMKSNEGYVSDFFRNTP